MADPGLDSRREPAATFGKSMFDTAAASSALLCITFLTGIVLARALGPEGRGLYGTIQFWGQLGVLFFTFSFYDALIVRLRARNDESHQAVPFAILLAGSLLVFAAAVVLCANAVGFLALPGMASATVLSLLILLLAIGLANQGLMAIETASLRFGRVNLDRVLSPTLFMAAALFLAIIGATDVVTVLIAFALTKLPVLFARVWRFRHHLIGPVDPTLAHEVIRLGPRLHMATGTLAIAAHVDRIAVVSLWPADWIGFYFVAYSVAGAGMSLASQAIQITLLPHFSGIDTATKRMMVERIFRLALVAGAAVALPVYMVAPWLVPLAYGTDFTPASDFVRGVVIAMAFVPALWVVNVANRASERGRPGVEMALAALAVFSTGWLLTGFSQPSNLFVTMTLANLASIAAGLRHLAKEGAARPGLTLVPRFSDVLYLAQTAAAYTIRILRKEKR